jgi:hypothetical protein
VAFLFLALSAVGHGATAKPTALPAPITLPTPGTPAGQTAFYPFLPATANNTGAGILIITSKPFSTQNPGEGLAMAQWLNAHGLAAFILTHGNATAGDAADRPVGEVNSALEYLHAHAADFHLSATRVGLLGFGPGAALAANAAFANPDGADPANPAAIHPDFLALIYGASVPAAGAANPPPTFLIGSTNAEDNLTPMIDLWNYLRGPRVRVPVEAHFFPKVDASAGLAQDNASLGAWPDLFYNWVRAYGFLTDLPRVAIHGSVSLDGRPLPHGYLILTPLDNIGAGPIIAHVFNSTQGVAIGSFSLPAKQGPVPGRYRVDVRQNANRWLSNAFSNDLIRDPAFGHSRILSPSIDDQHSYTKQHPTDKDDIIIEIKPDNNAAVDIAVFSK